MGSLSLTLSLSLSGRAGVIGVVAALPPAEFEYMQKVQTALNQVRPARP